MTLPSLWHLQGTSAQTSSHIYHALCLSGFSLSHPVMRCATPGLLELFTLISPRCQSEVQAILAHISFRQNCQIALICTSSGASCPRDQSRSFDVSQYRRKTRVQRAMLPSSVRQCPRTYSWHEKMIGNISWSSRPSSIRVKSVYISCPSLPSPVSQL